MSSHFPGWSGTVRKSLTIVVWNEESGGLRSPHTSPTGDCGVEGRSGVSWDHTSLAGVWRGVRAWAGITLPAGHTEVRKADGEGAGRTLPRLESGAERACAGSTLPRPEPGGGESGAEARPSWELGIPVAGPRAAGLPEAEARGRDPQVAVPPRRPPGC